MTQIEVKNALLAAGIENAAWEAELLLEKFTGAALTAAVEKRKTRYPLQYILGEWWFYRERYRVDENCLIPRADTEILVDTAVHMLPNGAKFLDLCTGSGCIAVSTLATRFDTTAVAVDLFEKTLRLARENATQNGVEKRVEFLPADVKKSPDGKRFLPASFDAIISNPPYIADSVVPTLQKEVSFEPAAALLGGTDGLDFYRAILELWCGLLKPEGLLLFEIGYDQREGIVSLAEKHGFSVTVLRDLGGNDRVAVLKRH